MNPKALLPASLILMLALLPGIGPAQSAMESKMEITPPTSSRGSVLASAGNFGYSSSEGPAFSVQADMTMDARYTVGAMYQENFDDKQIKARARYYFKEAFSDSFYVGGNAGMLNPNGGAQDAFVIEGLGGYHWDLFQKISFSLELLGDFDTNSENFSVGGNLNLGWIF